MLEDNGRVFDAQGTYDDSGNYKGRDTPAEGPNEAQLRRAADPDAPPLGAPPTRTRIRTQTPSPNPKPDPGPDPDPDPTPGATPRDEEGNAWPGVWAEFQEIPPYLEACRLQAAQQSTK